MRPNYEFDSVVFEGDSMVRSCRIFGLDGDGEDFEMTYTFPDPVSIGTVADIVSKINNGQIRL